MAHPNGTKLRLTSSSCNRDRQPLVLGGTLVNGETVGPHEKRNGTIQGGIWRRLSAGDVVRIPPRVPHQLLLEGSPEFNYFVVKIKGY